MAILRVDPDFMKECLFGDTDVRIEAIGFDKLGVILLSLEGGAIPPDTEEVLCVVHTELDPGAIAVKKHFEFQYPRALRAAE